MTFLIYESERHVLRRTLKWDDCMVEFDGEMSACGEYFLAMQDAIDKHRAVLAEYGLPTTEPLPNLSE